jgi:spermidine synthase
MTAPQEATAPPRAGAYGLALGALFFFSGALGLLYEIVWFRRLHLALGVSLFAVGAVLSAYMLGLAVGSRWAARSPWLSRAPLTAYAGLELGIALYAIAFPLLVGALEALYPALFRLLEGQPLALSAARFVLAFVLLLPPTFLMGASLPAMAEAVIAPPGQLARRVAWLYALNTVGGVAGTLLAGFFLIEHLGITRSLYIAAAGSALVAVAAFALARHPAHRQRLAEPVEGPVIPRSFLSPGDEESADRPADTSHAVSTGRARGDIRLATSAALVAGAVSLASEIVWTRALVFFVHNSTYAFSAIVAVYLLGIAAGALVAARFARTRTSAVRSLAVILGASSVALLVAIAVYRHLPELAALLASGPPPAPGAPGASLPAAMCVWSWGRALALIFGQVAAVLFLPALLLGAVFPLTLELAPTSDRPAQLVGRLYALNAVGCVAGAVFGTFVLVALLGTRGALLLLAWLPVPVALWALREAIPSSRARTAMAGLFVAALAGGSLLAAPRGFYQDLFEKRFGRVVWFAEGITETVAVCEHDDASRWIQFSDGRGASGTWSFQGGWLYAHLPLLLHPRPRSAAVICFGTGNTLGAASVHPLEALDGIELSAEVVKAAPLFATTNHDVATSGRARIVIEDGRSYMLATDRRYDVITEEPPLVHTAGVVNLYSRDFYELCSRRLTDDGIMAVWLATWELETPEMRMLVRAFVDAFPHASLWDCTHPGEWLLIGSKKPLRIDLDVLAARMASPKVARDLARIGADTGGIRSPADLLSLHLMGQAGLAAFAGDAQPVTDDRSVVDFTTPRNARANFGLGEWVTGGLSVSGVGERGLQSELLLREFDRVYTFREPVAPLISSYGSRDPAQFSVEVREKARARELRAAGMMIRGLRREAADLRAMGQPQHSLESLERGLALVPAEARGPIDEMRAQLLREMGARK